MRYEQARQRSDGSGWAWTSMHDGVVSTAGGCVTWPEGRPATVEEAIGPNRKPVGEAHAHPTREEAERCNYGYELDRVRIDPLDLTQLRYRSRCAVLACPEWETHRATWPDGYRTDALCDQHATVVTIGLLHPFAPGVAVATS